MSKPVPEPEKRPIGRPPIIPRITLSEPKEVAVIDKEKAEAATLQFGTAGRNWYKDDEPVTLTLTPY